MKKLCLFLLFVGVISANSMVASSTVDVFDIPVQTSVIAGQYDLDVIIDALEDLGFEVEKLEVEEIEAEEKECKMTVKGTIDGKEVDLTIVIKGQSCAEFFKELLNK